MKKSRRSVLQASVIALIIFVAVFAAFFLCYSLSGAIEDEDALLFFRTLVFRFGAAALCVIVLGLAGLLYALVVLASRFSRLENEAEALKQGTELLRRAAEESKIDAAGSSAEISGLKTEIEDLKTAGEKLRGDLEKEKADASSARSALSTGADAAETMKRDMLDAFDREVEALSPSAPQNPDSPGSEESDSQAPELASALESCIEAEKNMGDRLAVVTNAVKMSGTIIGEISAEVTMITELAQMINRISAQTNILSMNAAIESAHAGSAGAGFSVVANEIKKLAESTEINAKKIQTELKTITGKTKDAQKASESSQAVMEEFSGISETLREQLRILALAGGAFRGGASQERFTPETRQAAFASREDWDSALSRLRDALAAISLPAPPAAGASVPESAPQSSAAPPASKPAPQPEAPPSVAPQPEVPPASKPASQSEAPPSVAAPVRQSAENVLNSRGVAVKVPPVTISPT